MVVFVGVLTVTIWSAILAFRGRKYWATWLMLIGSILQTVGMVAAIVSSVFMVSVISSTGPASSAVPVTLIVGILSLLVPLGLLLFVIGMLGICGRFGAVERRTAELETLNLQLQERLQE